MMLKVVFLEWEDARGISGPRSLETVKVTKPLILRSAGLLLSEDEVAVRIAQDTWIAEEESVSRDNEIIPRRNILSMQVWEVKDAPKSTRKQGR